LALEFPGLWTQMTVSHCEAWAPGPAPTDGRTTSVPAKPAQDSGTTEIIMRHTIIATRRMHSSCWGARRTHEPVGGRWAS